MAWLLTLQVGGGKKRRPRVKAGAGSLEAADTHVNTDRRLYEYYLRSQPR